MTGRFQFYCQRDSPFLTDTHNQTWWLTAGWMVHPARFQSYITRVICTKVSLKYRYCCIAAACTYTHADCTVSHYVIILITKSKYECDIWSLPVTAMKHLCTIVLDHTRETVLSVTLDTKQMSIYTYAATATCELFIVFRWATTGPHTPWTGCGQTTAKWNHLLLTKLDTQDLTENAVCQHLYVGGIDLRIKSRQL